MNCKPGDVAYVYKSELGNEGKIVTCLRLAKHRELQATSCGREVAIDAAIPVWITDTPLVRQVGGGTVMACNVPDMYLRPIRDNDQQDEMLTLAGFPKELEIIE